MHIAHGIRHAIALSLGLALVLTPSASAAKHDVDLVSRATGAAGAKGNGRSSAPAISDDGRFVAFESESSNLDPDDLDGTMPGGGVFVRDLATGTTTLVSRATGIAGVKANDESWAAAISADGRYVAFASAASNLHPEDGDGISDIFVRDLRAHTTTLVSRAAGESGEKADDGSSYPSITPDGRFVAFSSDASNLDPDDTDATRDVFVRDLRGNTTTLVSRATGIAGAKGNDRSYEPSISADGNVVAFNSQATNVHPDDSDASPDVYVRDLAASTTTLASRATGVAGVNAGDALRPEISANGRVVAFMSQTDRLDPADDGDTDQDVYVRDLDANTTTLVSRADGATGASADHYSSDPELSADGRLVAFQSEGQNLHPDDGDSRYDVYVRDVAANTTTLVSRDAAGAKGNGYSYHPAISADGRYVTYASAATNLHADDGDATLDVFRRDVLGEPREPAGPAPAGPIATQPAAATPAAAAETPAEPAIARLRLASRCVRRTPEGRVRVPMTMRLARPGAVRVRIDRAIGSKGRRSCPAHRRTRDHGATRYRRVATMTPRAPRAAAAAVTHRVTLDLRLSPGLYRITVRAVLENERLSRPARRWLRVTG
jgi:Tol biopolymer transport system component